MEDNILATNQESEALHNLRRNSILIGVAITLAMPLYLYLAISLGLWQIYAMLAINLLPLLAIQIARILIKRGKFELGVWIEIVSLIVMVNIAALLVKGFGLTVGLVMAAFIFLMARRSLNREQSILASVLGLISGVTAFFLDRMGSPFQVELPELSKVLPYFTGVLIFVAVFWGVRSYVSAVRDMQLRAKLFVGFGTLVALAILIAAASFITEQIKTTTLTNALGTYDTTVLMQNIRRELLEMRHQEKSFLLEHPSLGIDEAYTTYFQASQGHADNVLEISQQVRGNITAETEANLRDIGELLRLEATINDYQASFQELTENVRELGTGNTGLVADFYEGYFALESKSDDTSVPAVQSGTAELIEVYIRYDLSKAQADVDDFHSVVRQLEASIKANELLPSQQASLQASLDEITTSFDRIVLLNIVIRKNQEDLAAKYTSVEEAADIIETNAYAKASVALDSYQSVALTGIIVNVVAAVAAILAGIGASYLIVSSVATPVIQLTALAGEYGAGDFSSRVDIVSKDEIGVLSQTFNQMADEVQSRQQEVESALRETRVLYDVSQGAAAANNYNEFVTSTLERLNAYGLFTDVQQVGFSQVGLDEQGRPDHTLLKYVWDASGNAPTELLDQKFPLAEFPILQLIVNYPDDVQFLENIMTDERGDEGMRQVFAQIGQKGTVIFPLKYSGALIGAIYLTWNDRREYSDFEKRMATSLVPSLSTVAQNLLSQEEIRAALDEVQERTVELEASQKVTFAASERTTPEDFLNLIVNLVRDQFDFYHVQVYLLDEEKATAVLRESTGYAGRQLIQRRHQIPMERDSLVTTAIRSKAPVLVADTRRDPNFLPNELLPLTRSELVVPLVVEGEVIGALDVQDRTPERFTENLVPLFETMTQQVAFLFENNELLSQITRQTQDMERFTNQLQAAAEVAERLASVLDPEQLLGEAVIMMQSRFGLYHAHIYLADEKEENLVVTAGSGQVGLVLKQRQHSIPMDAEASIVARAARTRASVLVAETRKDATFMPNPLLPNTNSELAVPLVARGRLLGVLDMQDETPGRFTQADADTMLTLAGQIATTLENAQLFAEQRQAETRFRTVADFAYNWETWYDENDEFVYISPSCERVSGYTVEEFRENKDLIFDMVHPDDRAILEDHYKLHTETGETEAVEYRIITKDGELRWVQHTCQSVSDDEGNWRGRRGSNIDITQEKYGRDESALRLSVNEALTGNLTIDEVLDVIVEKSNLYPQARTSIYFFDPQAEERTVVLQRDEPFDTGLAPLPLGTRFPASEFTLIGLLTADEAFMSPNVFKDDRIDANTRKAIEGVGYTSMLLTPITARGEWLGVIFSSSKVEGYFDAPESQLLYRTLADLGADAIRAARLRADVEAREAQFRTLVESAPDLIALIDLENQHFLDVNPRFQEMFGYTPEEALEMTPLDVSVEVQPNGVPSGEAIEDHFIRVNAGEIVEFDFWFVKKNGETFPGRTQLIKMSLGNREVLRASVIDISERKQYEEGLVQTDRLKSEFLANMSHELRTPLNSIIGYTDVLLMGLDGELDEETMVDVQAIHDNSQTLLRIINDILDLAKIEAGRMTLELHEVDVKEVFEEVKTSNAGLLVNKPVEMKIDAKDDLPNLIVDPMRLNQILNNLVSNAVKFTEKGEIVMRAVVEQEWMLIEVQDTGTGIEPEDLEAIFEEFQQADNSSTRTVEGTGLGLAITRSLAELHGGSISVTSEVGKGSTFSVRLRLEPNLSPEIATYAKGMKSNGKAKKDSKKKAAAD